MGGGSVRDKGRQRRKGSAAGRGRRPTAPPRAGTAWVAVPAEAAASDVFALVGRLQPQNAVAAAMLTGLVIFSTTTALLHLRERRRWTERDRELAAEVASLRGAEDRAELLLGSERQLLVSWNGRDAEPRCEGDPTIAGEGATFRRTLAFGTWLAPADAAALETALDGLTATGEAFRLTARTAHQGYVDAEGRTIGGRAVLRLRDVSAERSE